MPLRKIKKDKKQSKSKQKKIKSNNVSQKQKKGAQVVVQVRNSAINRGSGGPSSNLPYPIFSGNNNPSSGSTPTVIVLPSPGEPGTKPTLAEPIRPIRPPTSRSVSSISDITLPTGLSSFAAAPLEISPTPSDFVSALPATPDSVSLISDIGTTPTWSLDTPFFTPPAFTRTIRAFPPKADSSTSSSINLERARRNWEDSIGMSMLKTGLTPTSDLETPRSAQSVDTAELVAQAKELSNKLKALEPPLSSSSLSLSPVWQNQGNDELLEAKPEPGIVSGVPVPIKEPTPVAKRTRSNEPATTPELYRQKTNQLLKEINRYNQTTGKRYVSDAFMQKIKSYVDMSEDIRKKKKAELTRTLNDYFKAVRPNTTKAQDKLLELKDRWYKIEKSQSDIRQNVYKETAREKRKTKIVPQQESASPANEMGLGLYV